MTLGCGPPDLSVEDTQDTASIVDYADELPSEFPMTVGRYWPRGAAFSPLSEGLDMEIVQGFQGGIHTEIAFEFDLGFDYADTLIVYFDLHAQTLLADEEVVAELTLKGMKAGNIGFGVFQSQTMQVIFEQNEAHHYADEEAVIVSLVTLEGAVSGDAVSVRLIDTGNETLDP